MKADDMLDATKKIPLAFALAVASGGHVFAAPDTTQSLTPGSLRGLIGDAVTADLPDGQLPRTTTRLAQWFNGGWFSCFYGAWRRC